MSAEARRATRRLMTVIPDLLVEEPLKTAAEVAAYLGVSLSTFYDWRAHGRGPRGFRVGGRVQFRLSEVNAWIEQQREPLR